MGLNIKKENNYKSKEILTLSPIEQRYIATCPLWEGRAYLEEARKYKKILRESAKRNKEITLSLEEISKPFPHISRLARDGFFEKRSVQSYFEGSDESSHNMLLYLFTKSSYRKMRKIAEGNFEEPMKNLLYHANVCAVKPVDLEARTMWCFNGVMEERIDLEYFGVGFFEREEHNSKYGFVHGVSDNGHVLVRFVEEDEFLRMKRWFEERQKSKENPFRKIKF